MRRSLLRAAAGALAGLAILSAAAPVALDELSLPARLRSTLLIVDQHPPGTVRSSGGAVLPGGAGTRPGHGQMQDRSAFLSFTIRRWSTDEENAALLEAFKSGGTDAVVTAMEKDNVGELAFDNELRWPIRSATTWMTGKAQIVRLATTGRILARGTGLPDSRQLVNIIELTLRRGERYGDGTLVTAMEVAFEAPGRIIPETLDIDTGTQLLGNVERLPAP